MDNAEIVARVLTESVLTLSQARAELGQLTGKRPDKSTVFRWVQRGVRGVRLESVRIGREILTSREAVTRFIVGVSR